MTDDPFLTRFEYGQPPSILEAIGEGVLGAVKFAHALYRATVQRLKGQR